MRKMLGVFAAFGVLGLATFALAAEPVYTTTGKIKSIDMLNHVVTLDDGVNVQSRQGRQHREGEAGRKGQADLHRIRRNHRGFGDRAGG